MFSNMPVFFLISQISIQELYFIEKEGDIGKTTSDVNLKVLRSYNQENIKFVHPIQIHFKRKNDSDGKISS